MCGMTGGRGDRGGRLAIDLGGAAPIGCGGAPNVFGGGGVTGLSSGLVIGTCGSRPFCTRGPALRVVVFGAGIFLTTGGGGGSAVAGFAFACGPLATGFAGRAGASARGALAGANEAISSMV